MKQKHDQSINTIKRSIPAIHSSKKKTTCHKKYIGITVQKMPNSLLPYTSASVFFGWSSTVYLPSLTTLSWECPKDPLADATCTPNGGSPHPQDHPQGLTFTVSQVSTHAWQQNPTSEILWNSGWVKWGSLPMACSNSGMLTRQLFTSVQATNKPCSQVITVPHLFQLYHHHHWASQRSPVAARLKATLLVALLPFSAPRGLVAALFGLLWAGCASTSPHDLLVAYIHPPKKKNGW